MLYIIFSLNIFQLKMSHLKKQTKKIDVFSPRGIVSENVTCDQKNQMRFLLLIFFFSSFGIFTIVKIPCRARAQVDHLNLYFLLCVDLLTMPHMIFGNKRLLAHSIVTTTSTATTPCCFFPLNKDTVVSEDAENKQHHFFYSSLHFHAPHQVSAVFSPGTNGTVLVCSLYCFIF